MEEPRRRDMWRDRGFRVEIVGRRRGRLWLGCYLGHGYGVLHSSFSLHFIFFCVVWLALDSVLLLSLECGRWAFLLDGKKHGVTVLYCGVA